MSEIAEIIDTLENKIQKLFKKINDLEEKNQALQREIKISVQSNQRNNLFKLIFCSFIFARSGTNNSGFRKKKNQDPTGLGFTTQLFNLLLVLLQDPTSLGNSPENPQINIIFPGIS